MSIIQPLSIHIYVRFFLLIQCLILVILLQVAQFITLRDYSLGTPIYYYLMN
jgi:hypothetical protein